MTTPLFWKSFAFSNQIFRFTLHYFSYGYWDHTTHLFIHRKNPSIFLKLCFLASLSLTAISLYLITESLIFRHISFTLPQIMYQLLFLCFMAIVYSSVFIVVPNASILGCQYYNSLIRYSEAVLKPEHKLNSHSLGKLMFKGKSNFYILNTESI